jgi:O-antigen/teichoic acid export membrane protein
MSLVTIFTIFSDLGLTNILTRELTKRTEEKLEYLSTALAVKLILLLVTIIIIAIFAPLISKFAEAKPLMFIIALTVAFESLRSFLYPNTRSQNKMEVEAGLVITAEVLTTFVVLGIFLKYQTVTALVYSYMIGNGIGLLITLFFLREYIIDIFKYFKKQLIRPILQSAWPFTIMGVFGVFMTSIDSVIIGIYTNTHILGLYAAAQRPISLLYILPSFISVGLFPIISKFSQNREGKKLSLIIEKSSLLSLLIALPIVAGGIITAGPIINVTFGYEFIGAVSTFQILLLSLLIVFPGAMLADFILAEDKQKVFIKSSFFGAITNVVLDLILIPVLGIAGSAIATVAALMVTNGILLREIKKTVSFNFIAGLKKMVTATIIMSLLAYVLKIFTVPLILIVLLSAVTYFGLLFIMKDQLIEDVKQSFKIKKENIS